jgi:exopolyphosphatase/guanosine-5'-triphosphate,3'-diphosphate pyrophosphatase
MPVNSAMRAQNTRDHNTGVRAAVLDVGSNSVLTSVADVVDQVVQPVAEITRVTALGEGVRANGYLGEAPMTRTLAAMQEGFAWARSRGAEKVLAAATMAVRLAANADEFITRAGRQNTRVFVISGDEEATLGRAAVTDDPLFRDEARITVIDPGGHSTEFVTWAEGQDRFRTSRAIGSIGLRDGALADNTPGPAALLRAVVEIDAAIGFCYRRGMAGRVVALGAAGTNLVAIRDRLAVWDPEHVHGTKLDLEHISREVSRLSALGDEGRRAQTGIEPGRERTVHIGALILERALDAVGEPVLTVSVRGWRHALLARYRDYATRAFSA